MKMWLLRVTAALVYVTGISSVTKDEQEIDRRAFELNDVIPLQPEFLQRSWDGTWINDTAFSFRNPGDDTNVYKLDLAGDSNNHEIYISSEWQERLNTSNLIFSPDGLYLLAATDHIQVYRHSSTARYALFNIEDDEITEIASHAHLQLCVFRPGGHSLVYVFDNNIYFHDGNGNDVQITDDGEPGVIYNGHADWVYEEEVLHSGTAIWFSPNGFSVVYARFDDTDVDTYTYYRYGDPQDPEALYPELLKLKYPKVGRNNPVVTLHAVLGADVVDIPMPEGFISEDLILGSVTFIQSWEIATVWLNRRQNRYALQTCQILTLECNTQRSYDENQGWIETSQIPYFRVAASFIEINWSHQSGDNSDAWRHLFECTRPNLMEEFSCDPLTHGRFTVDSIVGWNQNENKYVYTATEEGAPWRRQLYVTTGDGDEPRCLSCGIMMPDGVTPCGLVTASASPNVEFVAVVCQERGQPSITRIIGISDENFSFDWQDNQELRVALEQYELPEVVIETFPLEGGYDASVRLFLPPGLDPSDTETKYPMIVYVYAGPNTQTVLDAFNVGYHSYLTTNRRVIYCTIDGRGSGLKGQDMLFEINNRMGSVEVDDQLTVLQMMLDKYAFIDRANIGMWGWSYGGYVTALALQKDTDNLLKCGIAVAPVTSWLYYDTIYTERYMGSPNVNDNLDGYEAGDVNLHAELLRGKKFFLIHGNADDNVHYQHAMALSKVLQQLNIQFEQMSYPDEAHSLAGVSRHVYQAMDRFWVKCLEWDKSV